VSVNMHVANIRLKSLCTEVSLSLICASVMAALIAQLKTFPWSTFSRKTDVSTLVQLLRFLNVWRYGDSDREITCVVCDHMFSL
jgi:hypothetical protein